MGTPEEQKGAEALLKQMLSQQGVFVPSQPVCYLNCCSSILLRVLFVQDAVLGCVVCLYILGLLYIIAPLQLC